MSAHQAPPRQHDLFRRFPLTSLKRTSAGLLPVPYHIYDGHAMFLGGVADLEVARDLLASEDVMPVATADGHALMGVWVIDGTDASLGPHQELQLSFVVARRAITNVPAHPLVMLDLLRFSPDVRLLCHGLWNDRAQVVAYNREVLALDARLTRGTITRDEERHQKRFSFLDTNDASICSGAVHEATATSPAVLLSLVRLMGVRRFIQATRDPWLVAQVTNPRGLLPLNADAQAYIVSSRPVVQFFNPATDTLAIDDPTYRALRFEGRFIEHMNDFRFVYLNVHNAGDAPFPAQPAPDNVLMPAGIPTRY
jgi:hypothetical protein